MSLKRFELEQSILNCWNITDELNLLYESIIDNNRGEMTPDKIANILLGMKELYNLKFEKCFEDCEGTIYEFIRQK